MSTYLVTGATGFLGRHLLPILMQQGHEIVALVRRPQPDLEKMGVKTVLGDILDAESVKRAAKGCDGLIHCAGFVSRDPDDAALIHKINFKGAVTTIDAAKEAGIKRVVYMSTSGTVAISENSSPIPNEKFPIPYDIIGRWPYYRSKLYAEQEVLARNSEDFEVISLNPSLYLGPGDLKGNATKDIVYFLEERIPAIPQGGLSYVDIRDVAEIIPVAMKRGKPGQRYLLGACNITFETYLKRLERLSGVPAPRLKAPKNEWLSELSVAALKKLESTFGKQESIDETSIDMARYFWYLDSSLAEKELGFSPRDSIQTLRDTIDDIIARGLVWPPEDYKPSRNFKEKSVPLSHEMMETSFQPPQATERRKNEHHSPEKKEEG